MPLLCFDLLTRPKMPFKVMHRKEVTHSNGSYERKSRGRKLADEIGRGKKKIPLYSHRLTHRKRVTSELHDSYFRSMTITQTIPKMAEVTHPDRQISEEIVEAWRRVHITAWEFVGNISPTNWTEGTTVEFECPLETRCGRESHTRLKGLSGALIELGSSGERKRHNVAGHKFGVKILQFLFGLRLPLTRNPFRTLAIKWEVYIFIKKSSCVVYYCVCCSLRRYVSSIYMYISA